MNTGEVIKTVEKEYLKKKRIPYFRAGDVLRVNIKIKEGDKERIQYFEGVVIARKGDGIRETFKIRRIASGIGVERTFNLHSPMIESIKVIKHGEVSRAKLYYLRGKTGKQAKIKQIRREKLLQIQAAEQKLLEAEQAESALQAAKEAEDKAKAEAEKAEAKAKEENKQVEASETEAENKPVVESKAEEAKPDKKDQKEANSSPEKKDEEDKK